MCKFSSTVLQKDQPTDQPSHISLVNSIRLQSYLATRWNGIVNSYGNQVVRTEKNTKQ